MAVKKINYLPPIVGVSPNAFSRVVPASFLDNYTIICLKKRGETDYVKRDASVICAEDKFPIESKLAKQSTMAILKIPSIVKYINSLNDPHILIYKPMPELEIYCNDMEWKIIANTFIQRDLLENKKNFREMLIASGITAIEGETYLADKFDYDLYKTLKLKFGEKLVFQIAEMTSGGGLGTSFISSENDYKIFLNKLRQLKNEGISIKNVNVTKFIEGVPASIISVATPNGTITGTLQAQIQDIDLVNDSSKGSGLYCGHDFSYFNGNTELLKKAKDIAKKFGNHLVKTVGYKGLFGMDLLIDQKSDVVYPVECNPRYTDLFPIISMNCIASGLIPFDYYHILAFLAPGRIKDIDIISKGYQFLSPGSQLVLSTKSGKRTFLNGVLPAGVYKFDNAGEIEFVRGGYRFENLKDVNEFLITEGVPKKGDVLGAWSRVCRVVFKSSVLVSKNKLKPVYEKVIRNIYKMIDLKEVK